MLINGAPQIHELFRWIPHHTSIHYPGFGTDAIFVKLSLDSLRHTGILSGEQALERLDIPAQGTKGGR